VNNGITPRMPDLVIRIKKKNDGSAALSCTRADGSATWQQQNGAQGRFFPLHDLTHLAVETVLGTRRAFYGLLAEGWDLSRFAERGASMVIPDEAELIEVIVGMFDVERASGERPNAEDFAWKIGSYREQHGRAPTAFRITDEQIAAVRQKRAELFAKWNELPRGDTLELAYDRPAVSGVSV
jgi:hypothetical protein